MSAQKTPTRMSTYTEDTLVEQPALELLRALGWHTANGYNEIYGDLSVSGRETLSDVILPSRLRQALQQLNPDAPREAIQAAIEQLARDRSVMSLADANQEIYKFLRDGITVTIRSDDSFPTGNGDEADAAHRIRIVDWDEPANNDFFALEQMWIDGDLHQRRPDIVGLINGLPLVLFEFKAPDKNLYDAYHDNLRDYKDTIPALFWYNQLVLLSNGTGSLVGSMTAPWEHFGEWKRIGDEGEQGIVSLETLVRGVCEPARLLDLMENFILFELAQGGLRKLLAKNHQYLGVNRALQAVQSIAENRGRLGVFWHTQGSGKSYSMAFFAQKILRKLEGDWTFLIVTDRDDLDEQIYKNFASVGVVTESEGQVRARNGKHLQQLLTENHRLIFTLIQKFRAARGEPYPVVSTRDKIIVMADEAHRTQYDIFAANLRRALPNAAFIGFTGTPLIEGEEATRREFGDYVSIYNFKQSVDDRATVPLYYENRVPKAELTTAALNEQLNAVLDQAALDAEQERLLEQEFAREYEIITDDDRLETVAQDIVQHFTARGYLGKALVVAIDKATAVKLYDKVQKVWQPRLAELQTKLNATTDALEREDLIKRIQFMQTTDMAVVTSPTQNEIDDLRQKGADILPHRERQRREDLDTKFKDPDDPFRLVFVCAMWMTGFDAPSCSTIYLDKPMKNHTLMQTIARANRVYGDKVNGLIVDYIGVFRNLQKALAIYGSVSRGGIQPGEMPVQNKAALRADLVRAVDAARAFCDERGVDLDGIARGQGLERLARVQDAINVLVANDATKEKFQLLALRGQLFYRAVQPDAEAVTYAGIQKLLRVLAAGVRAAGGGAVDETALASVGAQVDDILEEAIDARKFEIHDGRAEYITDLSKIDFEALRKKFETGRRNLQAQQLRGMLNAKLKRMVRLNKSRLNYQTKFQQLVDDYNSGAEPVEIFFAKLVAFTQELTEEDQRCLRLRLTEEELAVFDLLAQPDANLTDVEQEQIKAIAKSLLDVLHREKLVLDWRKKQQARAGVELAIRSSLQQLPLEKYPPRVVRARVQQVYQHVYDSYYGAGASLYAMR